jgi:tetratricopeptide (TPR) repeat protein
MQALGDIPFFNSDREAARQRYEAALLLYQQVRDVRGEAGCILSLGEIALARSDHDEARERYKAALLRYQKFGDVLGEANCMQSLGDTEEASGNIPAARESWREALALYAKIPDPYSIGTARNRLRCHAATPEEAAEHREAARKAWESIDRPDLIEEYLDDSA